MSRECPYCNGLGQIQILERGGELGACPTCHGAGYVEYDRDWDPEAGDPPENPRL